MKKTLFLCAVIALVTSSLFARELRITPIAQGRSMQQGTVEERARKQTDAMNATAQLTPEQYKKVMDIKKNFIGQRDAVRKSGAQGEDLRAKFKAIGEQEDAQLKGVLTPEQYAKVQAAKQERHNSPR